MYDVKKLDFQARELFKEERALTRLDGWFVFRETVLAFEKEHAELSKERLSAEALCYALERLPLSLSEHAVFAGTERDAFAQSYALINPNFKVSTFNGYCDPTAVFSDVEPNEEFTSERIAAVKAQTEQTPFVQTLKKVYANAETDTKEVAYFIEQVTGHLIPDFKGAIKQGVNALQKELLDKAEKEENPKKKDNFLAFARALDGAKILAKRYKELAVNQAMGATPERKAELSRLIDTLDKVPACGAENLFEAIQSYMLLWQTMNLEQAPNPFAFSVGNADRIFEPYRQKQNLSREEAAGLFKHFLLFFNVGSRSWAISQNIIIGGKDGDGSDLTSETSYALLDAYYSMNFPQPILSVKLHKNTPDKLYKELGKFFFTPGALTPSLFNDDAVFPLLKNHGVESADLPNYSIAGCQEPLIMGKDNGNTTNSWLNLAKILELTLNGGKSLVTGETLDENAKPYENAKELLSTIRERFYEKAEEYIDKMCNAANGASVAVSHLKVPFLSCFMGGANSGVDARDIEQQGTPYNGSGCLIHGLSVVADSFTAIDELLLRHPEKADELVPALQNNFESYGELRKFLLSCPKYGNNHKKADEEAAQIAKRISKSVCARKNYLGNPFRADWSSPTTHLTYGYWVGATPDGREARSMLGYGVDPLFGKAENGLGMRVLSLFQLDFTDFCGGYASHLGLDPKYFKGETHEEKGMEFKQKILAPLFFSSETENAPFYLYVNVTTPEILRKVLKNPKKYAPSGVYIMRIHGTFVNFLDLSPDVQEDIVKRLDLPSTKI